MLGFIIPVNDHRCGLTAGGQTMVGREEIGFKICPLVHDQAASTKRGTADRIPGDAANLITPAIRDRTNHVVVACPAYQSPAGHSRTHQDNRC